MKWYNIVFSNYYSKEVFINYLRTNYITFEVSGYDNGYYINVYASPATVEELNNYIDNYILPIEQQAKKNNKEVCYA